MPGRLRLGGGEVLPLHVQVKRLHHSKGLLLGFSLAAALSWFGLAAGQSLTTRPAITTRPAAATQPAQVRPALSGPVKPAENPHWTSTGCSACHVMVGNQARPIPVEQVESICVKCHDGRRASQEPHPVGRLFSEHTVRPQGWPTPDGKVTCVTCHIVHPRSDPYIRRLRSNPMFLREWQGDMLAFCAKCHTGAKEEGRFNPHVELTPDGGARQKSCGFCHTKEMPSGAQARRTGDSALRTDGVSLCLSCHTRHVDWFDPGHIGAKVTPEVRAELAAFEAARRRNAPAGAKAEQSLLPLGGPAQDTVVCSTCHNPHQEGLFPADSVLSAGAMRPGQPSARQLHGLGKEICGACHGQ